MQKKPIYTVINESSLVKENGKFIIKGKFSECDVENANGRTYTRKLMESILSSDEIKSQLADRQMLGELGHPEDRVETMLKEVSHVVTKLELKPNGEIYGEAEVLDTPNGQILKTLYEANIKLGISSRGCIPEESDFIYKEGKAFVPDDYELVSFDVVLTPSCFGAYPVKESVKQKLRKILTESKDITDNSKVLIESLINPKKETQPLNENQSKAAITIVLKDENIASSLKEGLAKHINFPVVQEGKSLNVFAKKDNFGFKLLSSKLKSYLTLSKINEFDIKINETVDLPVINKNLKLGYNPEEVNKVPEVKTDDAGSQELIKALEAKKAFAYRIIDALISQSKMDKTRLKSAVENRSKLVETEKQLKETKESLTRANKAIGAANEKIRDLSTKLTVSETKFNDAVSIIDSLKTKTTCSESEGESLKNKYIAVQKQNHHLSSSLKVAMQEKESLTEQVNTLTEMLNSLKDKYLTSEQVIESIAKKRNTLPKQEEKPANESVCTYTSKQEIIKPKRTFSAPKPDELPISNPKPVYSRTRTLTEDVNTQDRQSRLDAILDFAVMRNL